MMEVPSFTLTRQIKEMEKELSAAIQQVMESGQFILGDIVKTFEEQMADYTHSRFAIGVGNGSDALYLALRAADIGAGDEVLTTPFTFFATAGSILRTGAKPVFTDIQVDTFNMDPEQARTRITPRTRAVLPVHLFGLMADVEALRQNFDGIIIEDAAQAIGATLRGKPAGSVGNLAAFSFFPTKNLGALGDGGMVTTQREEWANAVRALRAHGARKKYYHEALGINSRLDALQAAILSVKLPYLDRWTQKRQYIAKRYSDGLHTLGLEAVHIPVVPDGFTHVFHQYTIRVENRDRLQAFLKSQGIGTTVYYPLALHLQPALRDLGYHLGDFPISEQVQNEVLSLPMFPELTDSEVDYVIEMIGHFYGKRVG
ncbi:DegT/DnrJ/EryC1/StrS family aminotransferase [Sulfobacillus thermosulfidooxidans]|uniref:DegT/DnrJ/EryC1/StrS family aminotransferase n=1 Tax=Sulfobacillus thermosulfidooxidans TaxID=28034 RepID=UPI0004229D70|nr:DegT/DnrJ/EryC1/StrS family aminotransferase [Sulfobacillus thermosulfidooxidans]